MINVCIPMRLSPTDLAKRYPNAFCLLHSFFWKETRSNNICKPSNHFGYRTNEKGKYASSGIRNANLQVERWTGRREKRGVDRGDLAAVGACGGGLAACGWQRRGGTVVPIGWGQRTESPVTLCGVAASKSGEASRSSMDSIERQSMRDVHDGEVLQDVVLVGLKYECLRVDVLVGLEGDVVCPG